MQSSEQHCLEANVLTIRFPLEKKHKNCGNPEKLNALGAQLTYRCVREVRNDELGELAVERTTGRNCVAGPPRSAASKAASCKSTTFSWVEQWITRKRSSQGLLASIVRFRSSHLHRYWWSCKGAEKYSANMVAMIEIHENHRSARAKQPCHVKASESNCRATLAQLNGGAWSRRGRHGSQLK